VPSPKFQCHDVIAPELGMLRSVKATDKGTHPLDAEFLNRAIKKESTTIIFVLVMLSFPIESCTVKETE
jgi:hypothetical protein